ncbi:DNA-binding PucR family transcriptional regulator [Tamaricihabitans halophyticus]|uniref:DNA-binding PucR family transcriptional regulator n=1 Tax=Tamaricihabitans halophyticus TaxID=1262583 RepID=A0A4V2SSK7_9PSEU|nr:PucR family transcriptional regulator [Tamaricihabitans halophyticus]TCP47276.1 DNA-binding PucR family transcriptional regulator [Tamaricihabitans halophyticus]
MSNYNDVQPLVDALAERLRRSVAIDDPAMRLVAASRHFGDEDDLRIISVINRAVPDEVLDRYNALGGPTWTEPRHVAGHDYQGAHADGRLCVPVRCNGLHLGYLWLIDRDRTLTDDEISSAVDTAAQVGVVRYREFLLLERSKTRHEAILRELVSSDPVSRERATEDLQAEELLPESPMHYQVLAAQAGPATTSEGPRHVAVEAAAEEGVRALPGTALFVANRSRAWILVAAPEPPSPRQLSTAAARITAKFHGLTSATTRIVVGVGRPVDSISTVVESHREALLAARAALLIPALGEFACWGNLGAYELLLRIPTDEIVRAGWIPALDALDAGDPHGVLIETLEVFLDNAGDVRRAAERLRVHRATFYQRLKRIEQLSGSHLDRGEDRLTLHLGLKLRGLAASYQAQTNPPS